MNRFKVLYCIGSLCTPGGTERVLSSKASIFADKYGIEIHICTISINTSHFYKFSKNIIFHNLSSVYTHKTYPNIPMLKAYLIKRDLYKAYENLIKQISPNVVIVLERGTDDFYIPNICHKLNIPVAREFHFAKAAVYSRAEIMDSVLTKWSYILNYKRIFNAFDNYDYMLLLTEKDQREGNYKAKTVVIPNIVPPLVDKEHLADVCKKKKFISVGSMNDKRKGFDSIIKAWSTIAHKYSDWTFEIWGKGPYEPVLRDLIEKLGLEQTVKLCGTTNDVASKYCESAFYVSGAVAEGLPMVLIEAMSCGLPCVAYDCPTGPSDIIEDGKDGILVPLHDLKGLAEGIEKEITDIEMRLQQSYNARKKSMQFTENIIVPKWLDFFSIFGYKVDRNE